MMLYWLAPLLHAAVRAHPQGQNGGGGGGGAGARPGRNRYALCALASCRIPRFLLGLLVRVGDFTRLERVGDFMQTLNARETVCMVQTLQTLQKSA